MVKRKFNLKKEYSNSLKFIKNSKNFIYAIIGIFLLFCIIGFFFPTPDIISERIMEFIKETIEKTKGMGQGELIGFLFWNNLQSGFLMMFFGVFLGIPTLLATISNGYILGFVADLSVQNAGVLSLWRILPHGIFELPAIFLSFGMGLKIGISFLNPKKFGKPRENLLSSLKTFLLIVLPLLIIAAIIEGTLIFFGA